MAFEIANLVAVFFIMGLWSILFKDTIYFRFTERTFVGVSVGIIITQAIKTIITTSLIPITAGDYSTIGSIVLGMLLLTKIAGKKYDWLSRYPTAILIGAGLAVSVRVTVESEILKHIIPVITNPLITDKLHITLGNIYLLVGLITGISFFVFTTEGLPTRGKQIIGYSRTIGRGVLMLYLGSLFANTLLGRSSMFLDRIHFILRTLGIIR